MAEMALQAEIKAAEIIDLDQLIVAVGKTNSEDQRADGSDRQDGAVEHEAATEGAQPFPLNQNAARESSLLMRIESKSKRSSKERINRGDDAWHLVWAAAEQGGVFSFIPD